jgi:hypothetical protein
MLCLVRSKACKRCGGDLSLECDIYGVYAECIQCGANWSQEAMIRPAIQQVANNRKTVTVKPPEVTHSQR